MVALNPSEAREFWFGWEGGCRVLEEVETSLPGQVHLEPGTELLRFADLVLVSVNPEHVVLSFGQKTTDPRTGVPDGGVRVFSRIAVSIPHAVRLSRIFEDLLNRQYDAAVKHLGDQRRAEADSTNKE